jgi:hypothetical protein
MKKPVKLLILFFLLSQQAHADILATIGGVNTLLYGVAAGIAALMIAMHAVKWKTAENPSDREAAKKGLINVILALVLIMIAAALVGVAFVKPPAPEAPPTTTLKNATHLTTTTTKTTTTTTTTTTTIPPEKLLTAKNLVDCINAKNGRLDSIVPVSGCPQCRLIKCKVFGKEIDPPVGPGLPQYFNMTRRAVTVGPYFIRADGQRITGCHTMPQINDFFGCDLVPVPEHVYKECREDPGPIAMDC